MPLDIARIRELRPLDEIHYFRSVESTMTETVRLLRDGGRHGMLVLAEEQTAGMGRLGRSWTSEPEVGIYASVLLRLPLSPANLPIASLTLGLATAEAIHKGTNLSCDLRWPNDVLINERKVAGILIHLVDDWVVAGIGINVNQTSFPTGLRTPATSLRIESSGRVQSRERMIVALLESIEGFCSSLQARGPDAILRAFASSSSYAINRRVIVEEGGIKGLTAGLDENGFLLVKSDAGRIERIASGGIRPDYPA
ncbi:MAG TPA: biotin--[acetyl-CoA-carboxylase] ligase [Bryobacteraceae bacterium]|jgi:BirA family biotin operon repressor/biotin-[acetyl-CoA-carboxylase] ligase